MAASMAADNLRLRMTMPSSVFCNCERKSRFIDPTTSKRLSITSALVCRLARESGVEPKKRCCVLPSARISNSSTPASSKGWR